MAIVTTSTTGYIPGGAQPGFAPSVDDPQQENAQFWPLSKLIRAYTTYLDSKRLEIQEQQVARRYRHGAQWTSEQIKVLNDRKQPVVTYNRIGRKIDGIVGLVERLRQDPKAYPRTPQHQMGADLATAVLRYVMDRNQWEQKTPRVSELAAIDGLAGIELGLVRVPPSPTSTPRNPMFTMPFLAPDYDVTLEVVDNDGFFYDPRSYKGDFSDARFIGMGKWVDEELLLQLLPQLHGNVAGFFDRGMELTSSSDRDNRWFQDAAGQFRQLRLVDIWYRHNGTWCWALFTGAKKLMEGTSPFTDEHGNAICKYQMFSSAVDHDGDRYGFPRNLTSAQDEINQRRSKGLHELNSRRIRAVKAAIADQNVEALRREAARADGIILTNTSIDDIQFDDQAKQAQVLGHLQFLNEAKQEIENFGPNPALVGSSGVAGNSGRAIALMQQSGIAELGPYMLNLRAWKLRVYRCLFNIVQKFWTNERWIRVTDNQGLQQFVQVNQIGLNGMGMPTLTNAIGELDVDIILDEGPDTVTLMQDTYDAISQALPSVAKILSPPQASAVMDVLIEASPLPADVKKKFRDASMQEQQQGPPPEVQAEMAKVQVQQQYNQGQLALEREKNVMNAQTKQAEAAADIEISNRKAQNDMAVERVKTFHSAQLNHDKMLHEHRLKQQALELGVIPDMYNAQPNGGGNGGNQP